MGLFDREQPANSTAISGFGNGRRVGRITVMCGGGNYALATGGCNAGFGFRMLAKVSFFMDKKYFSKQ